MIDREPGVGTEGEGAREQIMGTKIFAFPVRGRRWCFSALVPDVPAGKYSSVVTISQLWERLQSLPQFTDRAELIESFASAKVIRFRILPHSLPHNALEFLRNLRPVTDLLHLEPAENMVVREIWNNPLFRPGGIDIQTVGSRRRDSHRV